MGMVPVRFKVFDGASKVVLTLKPLMAGMAITPAVTVKSAVL